MIDGELVCHEDDWKRITGQLVECTFTEDMIWRDKIETRINGLFRVVERLDTEFWFSKVGC